MNVPAEFGPKVYRHIGLWLIVAMAIGLVYYLYHLYQLEQSTVLNAVQARKELIIVTRNAPTTYYETHNGQFAGIEYDMARAFAKYLKVTPRFIIKDSVEEILSALNNREADLAAAGLTITELREQQYIFGPIYQTVHQQVICRRRNGTIPRSMEDFRDQQLHVPAGTSYAERLMDLQKDYNSVMWQQNPDWDTEYLLEKVWRRKLDCTVADSNIFAINRRYYPELVAAFDLSDQKPLAWIIPKNGERLRAAVFDWFDEFKEEGKLEVLLNRYYGHLSTFDYVDTQKFRRRIKTRLPKYKRWFQAAARKYKLDWHLLAALSYQESHWNRRARSPTGVRGIMMLTLPTARQLGVKSRLDARANIFAGARYLAQLRRRLAPEIKEPERTWMALAAYNMGHGHLRDAIELARQMGKNPMRWVELEEVLPLLAKKKYYKTLKHGYARGDEAVYYVNQIRDYQDILAAHFRKK